MRHEKVFRNKDGSRTKVVVTLYLHSYRKEFEYSCCAFSCEKGKRTWRNCQTTDDKMQETKRELWQLLKP